MEANIAESRVSAIWSLGKGIKAALLDILKAVAICTIILEEVK